MGEVVLIVEDDQMIRDLIRLYVTKQQYTVIEAADGEEAKQLFLQHKPDLIILDLMLPKVSGEQFCKWVREDLGNQDIPIIMLSAKTQIEDRIEGLSLGADLYLTKPFHPEELIAYIETTFRRRNQQRKRIKANGLELLTEEREVYLRGEKVYLTRHEFDLLSHLMQHPNIVFTREQLVRNLYKYDEQNILDRTIDAHIKKLREKIEEEPSKPKRIQTVRGMGYKFVQ
ncbi:MAG TPA: response regulator transcription factor [Pseudogracilibacillus sp.]|nr:response regulator transcription factor [Pseudogracilibacillus sp.]